MKFNSPDRWLNLENIVLDAYWFQEEAASFLMLSSTASPWLITTIRTRRKMYSGEDWHEEIMQERKNKQWVKSGCQLRTNSAPSTLESRGRTALSLRFYLCFPGNIGPMVFQESFPLRSFMHTEIMYRSSCCLM